MRRQDPQTCLQLEVAFLPTSVKAPALNVLGNFLLILLANISAIYLSKNRIVKAFPYFLKSVSLRGILDVGNTQASEEVLRIFTEISSSAKK